MERRKFLASIGSTAAVVSLAGCAGFGGSGEAETDTPEKAGTSTNKQVAAEEDDIFDIKENDIADEDEDNLKIQNSRLVETEDGAGVFGDVKNTGNETFTFLEVTATLYDESDDVLGEFFDNTEGSAIDELEPGAVWDFEIFFEAADLGAVASYSLEATGEVAGEADANGNETAGNESA